jgi:hypothetical protein
VRIELKPVTIAARNQHVTDATKPLPQQLSALNPWCRQPHQTWPLRPLSPAAIRG